MERLYYLDYLRAFAMIVGILLHVTTLGDFGWLEVLGPVSHNFRMGTFFAVSGFFAALLLDRRGLRGFLGSRLLALGLPLAVGLVLLNPLTLWMVHAWRLGPVGPDQLGRIVALSFDPRNGVGANFDWHLHLWFLISLLCYTLAAPLLRPGLALPGRLAARLPEGLAALGVALGVALAVTVLRGVFSVALKPLGMPWVVLATLAYAPYYLLGLMLYGQPRLWDRLHRIDLPLIALAAGLWALTLAGPALSGGIETVLGIFRRELTVCASLFALLALSRRVFRGPNRPGQLVADGIYTAYLLHYMAIYALALLLQPVLAPGSAAQFWIIALLTTGLTLAFHHLVVARVPVLLLLLNGRRSPRKPAHRL